MSRYILATVVAATWIAASEFIRNSLLFQSLWEEHYKSLGLIFPNAPTNGMVWLLWSLVFAAVIVSLAQRFSWLQASTLAWSTGFVMMWLVIGNLGVLPIKLLVYAIPLSLIEAGGAAWIGKRIGPTSA